MAEPEPTDGDAPLSDLARQVVRMMGEIVTVAVPEATLASLVGVDPDGPTFDAAMAELESAGLAARWATDGRIDGASTGSRRAYSGRVATLTRRSADALGVRLNALSTRWIPRGSRERDRPTRSILVDGIPLVINETDMAVDPPGKLEDFADPGSCDPADRVERHDEDVAEAVRQDVAEANRKGGLVVPLYLLGMDLPWPHRGQDRGPWAPEVDPRDNPRGPVPPSETCRGCGSPRPGHGAGPGEYCPVDDDYYQGRKIPARIRAAVARSPEVAARAEWDRERKEARETALARELGAAHDAAEREKDEAARREETIA